MAGDQVWNSLDVYRPSMNDPRSPYVQSAELVHHRWTDREGKQHETDEVILDARAKNKLGGYVATRLVCPLKADESIDTGNMDVYMAFHHFGMSF